MRRHNGLRLSGRHWKGTLLACTLVAVGTIVVIRLGDSRREEKTPIVDPSGFDPPVRKVIRSALEAVEDRPESGEVWGRLGMICHAHGLNAEARRAYVQAERYEPKSSRWPHLLGIVCEILALTDDAAGAYERALTLDPRDLVATCSLARIRMERGDDEAARQLFLEAVKIDTACVAARVGLGQLAVRAEVDDMAEKSFRLALESFPRCGPAHTGLAAVYTRAGDESRAAFHRAWSRVTPRKLPLPDPLMDEVLELGVSYHARIRRGELAIARGSWSEALENFAAAAALRGNLAEPRYYMGMTLERSGKSEEAIGHLTAATELAGEGRRLDARLALARLYSSRKSWVEASLAIEEVLKSDPENPRALVARGQLHFRQSRDYLALADYDRAIELHPEHAEAYLEKGVLLLALEREERRKPDEIEEPAERDRRRQRLVEARMCLDKVIELEADLARAYERGATARMQLHLHESDPREKERYLAEALDRYRQLVDAFPDRKEGYSALIRALVYAGKQSEAKEVLRRARRRWPGDPSLRIAPR